MSDKPSVPWPAYYATLWRILVDVGRENGYAMALHGSLARDLDVVAIPWTDDAIPARELAHKCGDRLGSAALYVDEEPKLPEPTAKPHGRLAWSLVLTCGAFVDLSVMSRTPTDSAVQNPEPTP